MDKVGGRKLPSPPTTNTFAQCLKYLVVLFFIHMYSLHNVSAISVAGSSLLQTLLLDI